MPRIAADTVARNRELRMSALMDAASTALMGNGRFTVDEVTSAAGLSRSAFYEYFASADDLTNAVLSRELDAMLVELAAVDEMDAPVSARVHAWVRIRLAQSSSRGERLFEHAAPADSRRPLSDALDRTLTAAPWADASRARDYIVALTDAGMRRLRSGVADPDDELTAIMTVVHPLLTVPLLTDEGNSP
ncbi:MAG: TetR family transcriptional regulator [Actinomycetales bacterium]|nr:TetR family transcriptional regulator [Actinomycetales bacterium]